MEKTVKLYDLDAYRAEFDAVVLSCTPRMRSDGSTVSDAAGEILYDVTLNQTLFFPEEGGQNADAGAIDGHPVLDVQISGDHITHVLDAPFTPGQGIHGRICWTERYSNMQQHSGEHILSGLVHSHFGYDNVGFHLGSRNITLDFNGFLDKEQLARIELLANEAVYNNLEITAEYPSAKDLAALEYRSKTAISGPVRIVTIPGYDVCACCAPHVKKTGEIGIIKITDALRYKGGIRISILCGSRALLDFRAKQSQISAISALLSAKPERIADAVARLKDENFQLKGKLMDLQDALIGEKAARISGNVPDICLFEEELEPQAHKKYVNLLTGKCAGLCSVFAGNDASGYRYIIASSSEDVLVMNERLKETFQARGGGSREMVQGSVCAAKEELEKLLLPVSSP